MTQRSGKEEGLIRATPRTFVYLRSGHRRAVNYAFFAHCPAWVTQTITHAGSTRIPPGPMPQISPDKGCAPTRPNKGCAPTRPPRAPEKGILTRSLSGQEDGPLPDWQVVCPPPRHPRAARYPRGLRGEQATVHLAQRSLPPCLRSHLQV
jgi:hypothetical protein